MKQNNNTKWKNGKQEFPSYDRKTSEEFGLKVSAKVLILLPEVGNNPDRVYFGHYHHDIKEWIVEGVSVDFKKLKYIHWVEIPEFSGEIKNLVKRLKRGEQQTSSK